MKIPGKCYLVGGAVRDMVLGRVVHERDWVVVGASEEEMVDAGFQKIGRHFPVFLHPHTQEEFALARSEKKTGAGHRGFHVTANKTVTLKQDLARRDLTMNAMAIDDQGVLVDPFNGKNDIENKVIKHVSDAFQEDPLRCFRVARFAAALPKFNVNESTSDRMSDMSYQLCELPAERVWQEFQKAMVEAEPARFFEVLNDADIADPWFSGLDLKELASEMRNIPTARRGPLDVCWFLDRVDSRALFKRLKAPKSTLTTATLVSQFGNSLADYRSKNAYELLGILEKCRCFRDPNMFATLVRLVEGFKGVELEPLLDAVEELRSIELDEPEGPDYGRLLRMERVERLSHLLHTQRN